MRPARRAGEENFCVFVLLDLAIKWIGLSGGAKSQSISRFFIGGLWIIKLRQNYRHKVPCVQFRFNRSIVEVYQLESDGFSLRDFTS